MKNLMLVSTMLLVLAGSAFTSVVAPTQIAGKGTKTSTTTTTTTTDPSSGDAIPPASCPRNDPNGCGIYD